MRKVLTIDEMSEIEAGGIKEFCIGYIAGIGIGLSFGLSLSGIGLGVVAFSAVTCAYFMSN